MGERHVLVTVQIQTWGRFCREPNFGQTCPYLDTDVGSAASMRCLLHHTKGQPTDLADHDTLDRSGESEFYQPVRADACMALDGDGVGP